MAVRRYILSAILVLLSQALAPAAFAAGEVRSGPVPGWVDIEPLPQSLPERARQVENGLYYLLTDTQIRPDGGHETFFYRHSYEVMERRGLESAGSLDVVYDPTYEDVVLHYIRVHRGGEEIDRLDLGNLQILRREPELAGGVIDGNQTVHLEIEDVRVGDVVDIAYSWERDRLIWPEHFSGAVSIEWSIPVTVSRYRLEWPDGEPLAIRQHGTDIEPTETVQGNRTIYEWRRDDPEPVLGENGTPDWFSTWGHVTLSDMTSWEEVAAEALPLFSGKDALPGELRMRADEIMANFAGTNDRITEALRFVQDNVRYVSTVIGEGSFVPRSPTEVFRLGYGDCKDKSVMLVALLRHMGIEAYPVLAHASAGLRLPERAPTPFAFNHAVVQVRVDGEIYWLEPTLSHQGGRFPELAPIAYGWVLPLVPGQTDLVEIEVPRLGLPTSYAIEHFRLPEEDGAPMTIEVATDFRGAGADGMRYEFANRSEVEIEQSYRNYYDGLYPGVRSTAAIEFTDDRDANRILVREQYELDREDLAANGLETRFPVTAETLALFGNLPGGARRTAYEIPYPYKRRHTIILEIDGRSPSAPTPIAVADPSLLFAFAVERSTGILTLDYNLETLTPFVAAADFAAFRTRAENAYDSTYWYLDITNPVGWLYDGDGDNFFYLVMILVGAVLAVLLFFGTRHGLIHDNAYAADGKFYPVSVLKFCVMSLVTFGLYEFFWAWKCWRWSKRHEGEDVWPFWRAFFLIFWLYALFDAINEKRDRPVGAWIGGLFAAIYLVWNFASNAASRITDVEPMLASNPIYSILGFSSIYTFVCVLPCVILVNALNGPDSEVLQKNSIWSVWNVVAVIVGLILFPLVILGYFFPEV